MSVSADEAFRQRLLETFRVEAGEHVQALSAGLIALERAPGEAARREGVESVFRGAHSLKGAARAVERGDIEALCQALESVFAALQDAAIALSPGLLDLLHEALRALTRMLAAKDPAAGAAEAQALRGRLDAAADGLLPEPAAGAPPAPVAAAAEAPRAEEQPLEVETVRIRASRLDALLRQAEGLLGAKLTAVHRAGEIGEIRAGLALLRKERARIAPDLKVLQRALERPGGAELQGRDVRQGLARVVEFLHWQESFSKGHDARLAALAKAAGQDCRALATQVDGLLDDVKKALMLPVSSLLATFPKWARDLGRDRGKEVELTLEGEGIEVDRRILEEMRDPLLHLLRNAVDHGIEAPEVRRARGKPPRGAIVLAVRQQEGGGIEMRVQDDGAGVDFAALREAARRRAVQDADELARLPDEALLPLLFHSGLTTRASVTALSGRGLGMAIVREKVDKLGGSIAVESRAGEGTCFRIRLPVTLATYRGVHVRAGGRQFVLPTALVAQAGKVPRGAMRSVGDRPTIPWEGETLALVSLAEALELPPAAEDDGDALAVVVLGTASRRLAFRVDEVLYEQEVLVKGLGPQLARVRNVAGATVLGTGQVVPILNVADLLRSALRPGARPAAPPVARPQRRSRTVLVAEDSITSRLLLQGILEAAGYQVLTAVDGLDAWNRLAAEPVDLVVSDVDMPRLSGFDLVGRIRADARLAELPVVLVTALGSAADRERGAEAGANAYIVKGSFDQSDLLAAVGRLL